MKRKEIMEIAQIIGYGLSVRKRAEIMQEIEDLEKELKALEKQEGK